MANGTYEVRMAKAKKTKPRERLFEWRTTLLKATPVHLRFVFRHNASPAGHPNEGYPFLGGLLISPPQRRRNDWLRAALNCELSEVTDG
jgi:hypothetical protein